ncbi:hypothetical protein C5167_036151 [Papaver somniferum]|nr:hypothetical protein C5167_036151 [Papaver somniferum]
MDEVRSEDLNLQSCSSTAAASGLDLVGKLIERAWKVLFEETFWPYFKEEEVRTQAAMYNKEMYSCGGTSSICATVSALFPLSMTNGVSPYQTV